MFMATPVSPLGAKKSKVAIGRNSKASTLSTQDNSKVSSQPLNLLENDDLTQDNNLISILLKEKLRLIREIIALYPEEAFDTKGTRYPYGDLFDDLYKKDLIELRITLKVYEKSKGKEKIK